MRGVNRYTATAALIAAVAIGWNVYVAMTADGVLEGRVTAADGAPVAGAVVRLRERTMVSSEPRAEVRTDARGRFRVEGLAYHHILLEAEAPGFKPLERQSVRLWFRGQHRTLAGPLRLVPAARP